MTETTETASISELEWVQLRKEMEGPEEHMETVNQRLLRKSKENPLVPLGVLATCIAFIRGLNAVRRGDVLQSNLMMRHRVGFQIFTIVAMTSGLFLARAHTSNENSENSLESKHQELQ